MSPRAEQSPGRIGIDRQLHPQQSRVLVGVGDIERRRQIAQLIAAMDHRVIMAGDSASLAERLGLELLRDRRPSAIVADPHLCRDRPGRPGLMATLGALGWETIPVVLLVDADDPEGRQLAWASDAAGVFIEPLDTSELETFLELVCDPEIGAAVRSARTASRELRR